MPTYIYEAYNREGAITHGEHEAINRNEVVGYLSKRELTPVSIQEINVADEAGFSFFDKLNTVDIMFLVRNLATTTKAGLPIIEALNILIADAEKKSMRRVLLDVQQAMKNGHPLSQGFEAYQDKFPPIFMGMIRAGEMSGQLSRTLGELAGYLSKEYTLRSKVKSALTYPIILLVASTLVVSMLLIFVLPRLSKAFLSSGVELPMVTKFFLALSAAFTWSFTLDFFVFIGLIWFFTFFRKTPKGKKVFFWAASHAPIAKDLVKKIALVRFARTFGNLMAGGMSAINSLELSAQSIGNQEYTTAIEKAIEDVKVGTPISESLGKYPELFPRIFISLLIVGERTGTLHDILRTFGDFYEEEVDNKLKDLTTILEPILLVVMGLLVGAIAVSIILPIYKLVGNFV